MKLFTLSSASLLLTSAIFASTTTKLSEAKGIQEDPFYRILSPLSASEIRALEFATATLQHYVHKSTDCYQTAAKNLKQDCSALEVDEISKTLYAVHLAKCDVAVAGQELPYECKGFEDFRFKSTSIDLSSLRKCVDALSRVSHLWTSYNGHTREVSLMCFAIRHDLERKLLQDIHNDMSRVMIQGFRLLQNQHGILEDLGLKSDEIKKDTAHGLKTAQELKDVVKDNLEKTKTILANLGEASSMVHDFSADMVVKMQTQLELSKEYKGAVENILDVLIKFKDITVYTLSELHVLSKESISAIHEQQMLLLESSQVQKQAHQDMLEQFKQSKEIQNEISATWGHLIDQIMDDFEAYKVSVDEASLQIRTAVGFLDQIYVQIIKSSFSYANVLLAFGSTLFVRTALGLFFGAAAPAWLPLIFGLSHYLLLEVSSNWTYWKNAVWLTCVALAVGGVIALIVVLMRSLPRDVNQPSTVVVKAATMKKDVDESPKNVAEERVILKRRRSPRSPID